MRASKPLATAQAHAEKVVEALNATSEGMRCVVQAEAKTVMCIVNAADGELSKLAGGVVQQVTAMDIPLAGWKVTMVNRNDYVVTRRF